MAEQPIHRLGERSDSGDGRGLVQPLHSGFCQVVESALIVNAVDYR